MATDLKKPRATPTEKAIVWKTQSFHSHPDAIKAVNEKTRTIDHLVSTQNVDRTGEVVRSRGAKVDIFLRNNPVVFWNHSEQFARGMEHELPIAKCLDIAIGDTTVAAQTQFAGLDQMHPFAARVFLLYRDRFLNSWSIGFNTIKESREKLHPDQVGRTIEAFELLEYSSCGLPCERNSITQFMKSLSLPDGASETDLEKALGLTPLAKYWSIAEQILPADGTRDGGAADAANTKIIPIPRDDDHVTDYVWRNMNEPLVVAEYPDETTRQAALRARYRDWTRGEKAETADPLRWNRDLAAKLFDVTRERNPAATKEIELAAKYLDCEIKELIRRDLIFAGTKMGAGLVALDEAVGEFSVEDIRHFVHLRGPDQQAQQAEAPLEHDVVKLNSKLRRSFLLNGTRFMRKSDTSSPSKGFSPGGKLVVRVEPEWRGISITVYAKDALGDEFCDRVAQRAASLKFYKGESFSLSGEFLDATDETWDDVFLTEKNEKAVKRVVELINSKGAAMENRGVIMLGEPGTGKTLATRVMRNETRGGPVGALGVNTKAVEPATFIWISARDFFRLGAFGGIERAFETAKDLAPSILVFEDVDNWIGRGEIDLLKTTMDGVSRSKGIATVLTTNDPAHFPTALIDRPGRFHDVLKIDLPDADQRTRMLARWAPDLSEDAVKSAVDGTDGYSGAHVRELARFAGIIREQDGIESPDEAIELALVKVREQRDLIGETHAAQGRYIPRSSTIVDAAKAWWASNADDRRELVRDTKAADRVAEFLERRNHDSERVYRLGGAWMHRDHKSFAGYEAHGYTAPAVGASSPTHVHDYELEGEGGTFEGGCAKHVADHSHRITAASLAKGETEPSDGHVHALMTAAEVIAALTAAPVYTLGISDLATKDGRVLAATNYAKLKTAHAMIAEVITAHDASRPKPEEPPAEDEPTKSLTLAEEISRAINGHHEETDPEAWFDGAFARQVAERLGGAPSPGAAGR